MDISFDGIPDNTRTPGAFMEIDHTQAGGVGTEQHRLLLIGQRNASSTGVLHEAVRMGSQADDQAATLWGAGSMLHSMAKAARAANANVDIWAVALDTSASGNDAATGLIRFTDGTALENGMVNLYIAGTAVRIPVSVGDTSDDLAWELTVKINGMPELPVRATYSTGNVGAADCSLQCKWAGAIGNLVTIRLNHYSGETTPAGVVITTTAFLQEGNGLIDITPALDAIVAQQYYSIACPFIDPDTLVELETEMDRRYGPMVSKTGHVFNVLNAPHSALTSFGNSRNSPHLSTLGGWGFLTAPWVIGAVWATVVEYYGSQDPARPFTTLPLPGVLAPHEKDLFDREERNQLLYDGISTFTVSQSGQVLIEQVITNYQVNSYNLPDEAYLKLNTKWTVDYMRERFCNAVVAAFPRYKLGDYSAPGQPVATVESVRGVLVAEAIKLNNEGLLEDLENFKATLIVQRSTTNKNRINAVLSPNLVNQFDIFVGSIKFII
ncbi:MAG TPA: phage tail sheath subtilisin-like domain-containing protein [Pseudomonas sp.]|uniref:phage tail sheath subtilisin-like domain-containing protein n=1 Tax=Pseudomonas sp. TaxID=306 RepID=UPI002BD79C02|nr:phage tail sheath subtilisin-like domain-containing protein [Pseudomonas sp.]HWH86356.1 phage tail sheath subtilisin-like domain-containing protein [Pseudomonas sp.]